MKSLLSLKERCNRSLLSSSGIRNGSFVIRNGIGFTLVELMIVIAIIGVLAASLFPMMSGYMAKSRDTALMVKVKTLKSSIELYYNDVGHYPNLWGNIETGLRPILKTGMYSVPRSIPGDYVAGISASLPQYGYALKIQTEVMYAGNSGSSQGPMWKGCRTGVNMHPGWWGSDFPDCILPGETNTYYNP